MLESAMKTFLHVSLASLLTCSLALAAADVSGRWASAPVYLVLKQDGNKLSGTGGPTETQQMVTFDNGTVEGNRVTDHPSGPRAFEVASVKRASPPPGGGFNSSMRLDPGRLTCTNVSLKK